MDGSFAHLRDFAAHFFSRSQVQLDSFADAALKDAEHGDIRLRRGFLLSEQTGTGQRCNDDYKR